MRKILMLTMVFVLAIGMVYAWGVDKTVQQKPASITATAPITEQPKNVLDKSSTEGPVTAVQKVEKAETPIQKKAESEIASKVAEQQVQDAEIAKKEAEDKANANQSIRVSEEERLKYRYDEIKADGIISPDERADYEALLSRAEYDQFPVPLVQISEIEPNDPCANAQVVSCGDTVWCANVGVAPDSVDYYEIVLAAGNNWNLTIETHATTGCTNPAIGDTKLYLYGPNTCTAQVAYNDDIGGGNYYSRVTPTNLAPGVYYARVLPYSSSYNGSYHVDFLCTPYVIPTGRCCDTTNVFSPICTDGVTQAACLAQPMSYWTQGLTCTANPCPARPANDDCATAMAIGDGSYSIDNQLALNSGLNPGGSFTINKDVFYCYTAPMTGTCFVEMCGSAFDTRLAIWDGCTCPPTTYIIYDDDACDAPNGLASKVEFPVVMGNHYLIQAGSYSTAYGTINMTVNTVTTGRCCYGDYTAPSCVDGVTEDECINTYSGWDYMLGGNCTDNPCPVLSPGDNCSLPLVVALPAALPYTDAGQTTCGRGNDYTETCLGSYDGGEDIIYELDVTQALYDVVVTLDPGADTWTGILLTDTCPPGATCIAYHTSSAAAPHSLPSVNLPVGTYYIMADTWPTPNCISSFTLSITGSTTAPTGACCSGDPQTPTCTEAVTEDYCTNTLSGYSWVQDGTCPDACPAVLTGDDCALPIVINALPFTDAGNTGDYTNACSDHYASQDVFYELDLSGETEDQTLIVSLCGSSFDTYLTIYQNGCCNGVYFAYNDDFCGTASQITATFPPADYFICVEGYSAYFGDYELFVGPPPTGRCCDYSADPYNPTCTDGVVQPDCQATGQFWAEGIDCGTPCSLPPANDDCSTAEVINGPYPYTGSGSNVAGQNVDCSGLLNWNAVWYAIDLPYDQNFVTITVCPLYGDLSNSGIVLMNDCNCDDYLVTTSYAFQECPNGHTGIVLNWQNVPGGARTTWYWPAMLQDAAGLGMDFTYEINVTPPPTGRCCDYSADPYNPTCTPDVEQVDCQAAGQVWTEGLDCGTPCPLPPANDECANAEDLGGTFPITGSGSSVLGINVDCPGLLDWNAVWYTFDLPYGYNNVTIQLCPTSVDLYTAGVILMNDCACDDYLLSNSYVFGDCPNTFTGVTLHFDGVPAGTWYWPEMGIDASSNGLEFTFEIDVTEAPTGRCCDYTVPATPVCTDGAYAPDCVGSSFTWTEGLNCTDTPCEAALDGDFCGNPIVVGALPYNSVGNTCTYHDNCKLTGENDNSDVLYEWTVATEYVYTVSLCGSSYDTKLGIFKDECCTGAGTEYAYNDDFCGLQSEITMVFIPGTYYVVVDGYGTSCGDYTLNITEVGPPPTGRCCYGDIYDLDCAEGVTQNECLTTYGSTAWLLGADCTTDPCPANGHFGVAPTELTGQVDEVGQVYTDNLSVANTGTGVLTFNASVSIDPPAMAANTVKSVNNAQNTFSSIEYLSANKPTNSTPANTPDPNMILQGGDLISSATPIAAIPYNDNGTTVGYTNDYDEVCPYTGSTSPDVVYSYAPAANEWINVDLYGSSYDTKVYIYEDAVGNVVACNDDYYTDYTSAVFDVGVTTGHTYYIVVDGYGGNSGAYIINVTMGTEPPVGRCCDYTDPYNPVCTDNVYEADCAGSWTEGLDCSTPCPEVPHCQPDALFGQNPNLPSEAWSFAFDDVDGGYVCYENFGGIFGTIEGVTFWGLGVDLTTYAQCDVNGDYQVIFYEDNGGVPGAVVASYDVVPTVTGTGLIFDNGTIAIEMMQLEASFDPISLSAGWVSIQNVDADGCTFAWAQSFTGDGHAFQNTTDLLYDLSMCLTGTYVAPWLTIDTNTGAINPGDPAINIGVTMDATTLECGEYHGHINFTSNDPVVSSFSVPVTFNVCGQQGYEYLPGDANMYNGAWPPTVIGGDVTYLVNFFRGFTTNPYCLLGGFYCAADINGDCRVIGSDVTRLVSFFRGIATVSYCPDYEPAWHNSSELPPAAPAGWPNCETAPVVNKALPGSSSSK